MTKIHPLIISEAAPNQIFEHNGPMIFKNAVPDGVHATAKNGGILLERGGGNGLVLKAELPPVSGSMSGINIVGNNSGTISIGGSSGGVHIEGAVGDIFINGRRVNFNELAADTPRVDAPADAMRGVVVKGLLGHDVNIKTNGNADLFTVEDRLVAETKGSLHAFSVGDNSKLDVGGNAHVDRLGAQTTADVGGNLKVKTEIGAESKVEVGGNLHAETIRSRSKMAIGGNAHIEGAVVGGATLDVGGNLRAQVVGAATIRVGGNVTVDVACKGANITAGGRAKVQSLEEGVRVQDCMGPRGSALNR